MLISLASVSKTNRMLTVEEHNVYGGLGGTVSEVLSRFCPVKMDFVGLEDTFAESGPYMSLLAKYGISQKAIMDKARKLMS